MVDWNNSREITFRQKWYIIKQKRYIIFLNLTDIAQSRALNYNFQLHKILNKNFFHGSQKFLGWTTIVPLLLVHHFRSSSHLSRMIQTQTWYVQKIRTGSGHFTIRHHLNMRIFFSWRGEQGQQFQFLLYASPYSPAAHFFSLYEIICLQHQLSNHPYPFCSLNRARQWQNMKDSTLVCWVISVSPVSKMSWQWPQMSHTKSIRNI